MPHSVCIVELCSSPSSFHFRLYNIHLDVSKYFFHPGGFLISQDLCCMVTSSRWSRFYFERPPSTEEAPMQASCMVSDWKQMFQIINISGLGGLMCRCWLIDKQADHREHGFPAKQLKFYLLSIVLIIHLWNHPFCHQLETNLEWVCIRLLLLLPPPPPSCAIIFQK